MTTAHTDAASRVTYQLETLWDYAYEPTNQELETLYETAIGWTRPVGKEGPVLNENLMPRLVRLGLISSRIEPRYREIGLLA